MQAPSSPHAGTSPPSGAAAAPPIRSGAAFVPGWAPAVPGMAMLALLALALLPPIRRHPNLFPTFLAAAGVLWAWSAVTFVRARQAGRTLSLEVAIFKHHWVQACAQIGVLAYWGWHVSFVYPYLLLILAQLIFAYGVDSLLAWSRRDHYRFGFGPFPVVLSINLFLWFKPEWFHWQFVLIVVGYLAKEMIRWNRDGRSTHIFNPSSFPLAICSLILLLTGTTDITLGQEIAATQFNPPFMYLLIFLVAIPGQLLFGVSRMTMPAVVTMYAIGLLYLQATGTYLFYDAYISLPVFLGMHLLFTDPSTSPRSEIGQLMFGMLYALGTLGFYVLLSAYGAPGFYDKLLPVPLMNLTVRAIDRLAASRPLARLDPSRIGASLTKRQRNLAYTGVWAVAFVALSAVGGVGDDHPGQFLPFWETACAEGSERACEYAAYMVYNYCDKGSGWACNEFGIIASQRSLDRRANAAFARACDLRFEPGCANLGRVRSGGGGAWSRAGPRTEDLPIVLRGSKGPVEERDPARLHALGCRQGWAGLCAAAGVPAAARAGILP